MIITNLVSDTYLAVCVIGIVVLVNVARLQLAITQLQNAVTVLLQAGSRAAPAECCCGIKLASRVRSITTSSYHNPASTLPLYMQAAQIGAWLDGILPCSYSSNEYQLEEAIDPADHIKQLDFGFTDVCRRGSDNSE